MTPSIVSAVDVTKSYGLSAGVFEMDLDVGRGQIVGLIGPSGSGKTTTVRLMTGIIAPDSGELRVLGARPTEFSSRIRSRLGYMPQDSALYPDLTLRENLDFAASLYGMPLRRAKAMQSIVELVELGSALDRRPGEASGGEQRRAMLAASLVHQPDLVFLDEPTAGIDPVLRRKFWDRFEELSAEGRTLIITTQYVGEAAYCDYVAVLDQGRVLAYETPDDLRRKAFQGEVIELSFRTPPSPEAITALEERVIGSPMTWLDTRTARAVVDDAGATTPELAVWAEEQDLDLEKAETYLPPFDDVFVRLIEKLGERSEEGEPVD